VTNRWQAHNDFVQHRAHNAHIPSPTADWVARVEAGVEVALRAHQGDVQQGLQLLHDAVRERAAQLRQTGWRVEQVLMAVKRDVARSAAAVATREHAVGDAARVPALLDAVVRWCVATFYVGN
jgi:hypothetical protein